MKICLIVPFFDPWNIGGAEKYAKTLAEELSRQHQVVIITTAGPVPRKQSHYKDNIKIIEINESICKYCDDTLIKKRDEKDHILIMEENGEIMFESRILDKNTILVSGIFSIDKNQKLKVTQNYIILPFGKWIMHDRINSNNGNILITADGIKISE